MAPGPQAGEDDRRGASPPRPRVELAFEARRDSAGRGQIERGRAPVDPRLRHHGPRRRRRRQGEVQGGSGPRAGRRHRHQLVGADVGRRVRLPRGAGERAGKPARISGEVRRPVHRVGHPRVHGRRARRLAEIAGGDVDEPRWGRQRVGGRHFAFDLLRAQVGVLEGDRRGGAEQTAGVGRMVGDHDRVRRVQLAPRLRQSVEQDADALLAADEDRVVVEARGRGARALHEDTGGMLAFRDDQAVGERPAVGPGEGPWVPARGADFESFKDGPCRTRFEHPAAGVGAFEGEVVDRRGRLEPQRGHSSRADDQGTGGARRAADRDRLPHFERRRDRVGAGSHQHFVCRVGAVDRVAERAGGGAGARVPGAAFRRGITDRPERARGQGEERQGQKRRRQSREGGRRRLPQRAPTP